MFLEIPVEIIRVLMRHEFIPDGTDGIPPELRIQMIYIHVNTVLFIKQRNGRPGDFRGDEFLCVGDYEDSGERFRGNGC